MAVRMDDPARLFCQHCGFPMIRETSASRAGRYRCYRVACRLARGLGPRANNNLNKWGHLRFEADSCDSCHRIFWPRLYKIDHILAMSRGGSDTRDNVQVLCPRCEHLKTLDERGYDVPESAWPNAGRPRGLRPNLATVEI